MKNIKIFVSISLFILSLPAIFIAQPPADENKKRNETPIRVVTIPISIYTKKELKENKAQEFLQADRLTVEENEEEKTIISISDFGFGISNWSIV